jgi:hypothetical protein
MNVTRRNLLLGALSVPAISLLGRSGAQAAAAGKWPNPLIVTISGADAAADPIRLATIANPFQIRGIPVTLTINPYDGDGAPLDYDSRLAQYLRETISEERSDLEIGLHAETIESADPYYQLRQISTAQAVFSKAVNAFERYRSKAVTTAYTLSTNSPLASYQDGASMRATGIRSIIRLSAGLKDSAKIQPDKGGYWVTDTGLANIFGSHATSTRPGPKRVPGADIIAKGIATLSRSDEPVVVDIPFGQLAKISEGDLASYATEIAHAILEAVESSAVRAILPMELHRQSQPDRHSFVIVRFDDLRVDKKIDREQMAFIKELVDAGYPVTEAVVPAPSGRFLSGDDATNSYLRGMLKQPRYDVSTHGWQHLASELEGHSVEKNLDLTRYGVAELFHAAGRVPTSYIPPNNAYDENTLIALSQIGTPIISAEKRDFRWFAGLDERGLLHASNTVMFEKAWDGDFPYQDTQTVLDMIGDKNDAVFSIHVNTANTPEKMQQIRDVLTTLSGQAGTRLVNFAEYRSQILPALGNYDRILNARAEVMIRDWKPADLSAADESALKRDAELAWRYFDWGMKTFKGIAPGTSWIEDGKQQGYPYATMWDVASTIMASVSAKRMGLIDERSLEERGRRIVEFLGEESFRYAGVRLPPAERRLSKKAGERQGFDSADTGRLLIALKVLDNETAGSLGIDKVIARWGFHKILINGEMYMVSARSRRVPLHQNSYANYVSNGYRLWGFETKPVFGDQDPSRNMDDAVAALDEITRRGRIATEPHLTEEIELGGSPHGRLAADILFEAQVKRYRETGVLTATSEGPAALPPYFTYQGYQVTPEGGDFVVDAPLTKQAAQTAKRADDLRMINSKASFLWYACRQGDYSNTLISFIREKGKMPGIGFASGVGEISQSATGIADVNTNGIILEAISYILAGRTPFLAPEVTSGI